jgi:hypothetical protein
VLKTELLSPTRTCDAVTIALATMLRLEISPAVLIAPVAERVAVEIDVDFKSVKLEFVDVIELALTVERVDVPEEISSGMSRCRF